MQLRRITVLDTTLRDGEQSPGIALSPDEKAEIAAQIERLGVDVIEAGFPIASPGELEGVKAVARSVALPVSAFARAKKEDIDAAAEGLADARRSRIHVVLGTSPIHMEKKLGLEAEQVLEQARWSAAYARTQADEVEFSCEDATRSDPAFVAEICREVIRAGVTTVNLPDTVGYSLPDTYEAFLIEVQRLCPELREVTLSVHCHNDLGLAVANTLAGVRAGARQVECTVNGIGERAGNAALEEVVMALAVRSDASGACTGVVAREVGATSTLVSRLTGYAIQRNKAIVGDNAFAHEAGIHQDGLLKDTATYQIIDPAELGLAMTLPLGKHSGRHAFSRACAEAGLTLSREELNAAFARFKQLADDGHVVTLDEVFTGVAA